MHRASSPTGWVRNPDGTLGWIWNPLSGCENHTLEGLCLDGMFPCYAWKVANGRLKTLYLANDNIAPLLKREGKRIYRLATKRGIVSKDEALADPFYPRFWPERLAALDVLPSPDTEPPRKGIFVCDMSDLFGIGIPEQWTRDVLNVIGAEANKHHRFYLLTKQASRLPEFSPFPENCWVGVTATTDEQWTKAQIELLKVHAKIRFISFEPLLEQMEIKPANLTFGGSPYIHLVIIGACTGTLSELKPLALKYPELSLMPYEVEDPGLPSTRGKKWTLQPKIEWVQKIALACTKAHTFLFLKDNLRPLLPNRMPFYGVVSYLSADKTHTLCENRLRQEMPQAAK